jgi:hypothetical protein
VGLKLTVSGLGENEKGSFMLSSLIWKNKDRLGHVIPPAEDEWWNLIHVTNNVSILGIVVRGPRVILSAMIAAKFGTNPGFAV